VSQSQAAFVKNKAKQGEAWAKEWHAEDKKRGTKRLPRKKAAKKR